MHIIHLYRKCLVWSLVIAVGLQQAKHPTVMDAADITDKVTSQFWHMAAWVDSRCGCPQHACHRCPTTAAALQCGLVVTAADADADAESLVVFIFSDHRIRNAGRPAQRCHGDDERCCVDLVQQSSPYVRTHVRTYIRTYAADVSWFYCCYCCGRMDVAYRCWWGRWVATSQRNHMTSLQL